MNNAIREAKKTDQLCYQKDGILYVPHLSINDIFVSPGFNGFKSTDFYHSKKKLEDAGANPVMKRLFANYVRK